MEIGRCLQSLSNSGWICLAMTRMSASAWWRESTLRAAIGPAPITTARFSVRSRFMGYFAMEGIISGYLARANKLGQDRRFGCVCPIIFRCIVVLAGGMEFY